MLSVFLQKQKQEKEKKKKKDMKKSLEVLCLLP